MKRLYVGNLPWSTTDEELQEMFSAVGNVESANVITDRETGRSRGFGFVDMDDADVMDAIEKMNGHEINGRPLRVNEAQPRAPREPRW